MIEFLEPALYNSISSIQAFQWISIAHQKVLRVSYSYSHKREVLLNLHEIPKNFTTQDMEYRHQYDEIVKHFAEGQLKEAGAIQKNLQLHNVNIASYYTDKYALLLDFRIIDDNRLHGSGRQLENTSEGIRLQITKKAESAGKLSCYLYIFQDAQISISDAQFLNVVY